MFKFTTLQAPNQEYIFEKVASYIGGQLGITTKVIVDQPWRIREELLDSGEIDIAWICGYPYIKKVNRDFHPITLLAAPVMSAPRYQNRPIYFSDVIVHEQSLYQSFKDLRGASWAYNEPGSHSGYILTCYHLATMGGTSSYFGHIVEAGSHQNAIDLIVNRQVDASSIDSTVLEIELQRHPGLAKQIRVIETLGPSPIPPWVISQDVPPKIQDQIRKILLDMHRDPLGNEILKSGKLARFTRVFDKDYDPIREMANKAEGVKL